MPSANQIPDSGTLQGDRKRTKKQMLGKHTSPDPEPPSPSCVREQQSCQEAFRKQTPVPLCDFFPPRIFPFTPNDTLLSFLSLPSPLLTFFTPSLPVYLDALPPSFLSLGVTRPIWAVWWSWEHRSLSGELSGALLKTQRADYCSCQSH